MENSTVSVRVAGKVVELLGDDRIAHHLRTSGSFEPETLVRFAQLVRSGSMVLDIGSYSGLYAILACKLGAISLAVEPLPIMVKQIEQNRHLNMVSFVICRAAASDVAGQARLGYNPAVRLTSGASLEKVNGTSILVNTVRMDDLIDETMTMPISVIKMDVEGHEVSALRGMERVLATHRPWIIAEANDAAHQHAIIHQLGGSYILENILDHRNLVLRPV